LAENTVVVGAALVVTGTVLFLAGLYMKQGKSEGTVTWKCALIIGAAQAASITPGLSRSGLTIAAAILCGIALADAVRFSFLLAIPAIIGGALYELKDIGNMTHNSTSVIAGCVVALIFGIVSLKIVSASVLKKKFSYFAFYCVPVGMLVIVLSLTGLVR
jgi:undecaprenyl-diphosphatase